GYSHPGGSTRTISLDIRAKASTALLADSTTGHMRSSISFCDLLASEGAGTTRTPKYGRPAPKTTASATFLLERIEPSMATGLNFSPLTRTIVSSRRATYLHALGIVGCGSNRSFVA